MWKRSDISQRLVLEAYALGHDARGPVEEVIAYHTGAPIKVIWAAMEREDDRGLIDYGSSLRWGWLTDEGRARLDQLRAA